MDYAFYSGSQIGFLIANLIVLGLNLKLYTEILKDRKMDARSREVK